GDVVDPAQVHRGDAVAAGHLQPLGDEVDTDDLLGAAVAGDAGAQLPDRAQPEDDDGPAGRHLRVLDGLPRGGHDVGEVEVALVRLAVVGHDDGAHVREGHA